MRVIEVCRKNDLYLVKHYHNNPLEMVRANDGLTWDTANAEKIKSAFGSEKNLYRYIRNNNKRYCLFYDLDKEAFI